MKIVAIRDMSAGNDTVGDMWQETKIFDPRQPLSDVIAWANNGYKGVLKKRLTLTVAHEDSPEEDSDLPF